jgi:hypothetical protein
VVCLIHLARAADLNFLHRCCEFDQELQIEKRHWKTTFASAPLLPKFVSGSAAMVHERRKRGAASAIRNRLDLHIRDCGVPPRNTVEEIGAVTWA